MQCHDNEWSQEIYNKKQINQINNKSANKTGPSLKVKLYRIGIEMQSSLCMPM